MEKGTSTPEGLNKELSVKGTLCKNEQLPRLDLTWLSILKKELQQVRTRLTPVTGAYLCIDTSHQPTPECLKFARS